MDTTTFRQRALEEIRTRKMGPDMGRGAHRQYGGLASGLVHLSPAHLGRAHRRLSLQRNCRHPLNDPAINRRIVALFAAEGADAWYVRRNAEEMLPAGTRCAAVRSGNPRASEKEMDILDVWFESGASQAAVLGVEPELPWPADLYSRRRRPTPRLVPVFPALRCRSTRTPHPTAMAGTCGWTLDEQGRAMSKSLGNGVDPVDIADRLGAEIVRLWVASVDFREDMAASENLMQRVSENYRKLRNTFRFLLGNLHGFEPESMRCPGSRCFRSTNTCWPARAS